MLNLLQEAEQLGIIVGELPLVSARGLYVVCCGLSFIIIDRALTATEKRCVLGHELGHHVSRSSDAPQTTYHKRVIDGKAECCADRWAAEHLIPRDSLEAYLSTHETVTAYDMADYFDVTEEVACFRVKLWEQTHSTST